MLHCKIQRNSVSSAEKKKEYSGIPSSHTKHFKGKVLNPSGWKENVKETQRECKETVKEKVAETPKNLEKWE